MNPATAAAADLVTLRVEPLTRAAFAPFGDVIEAAAAASHYAINAGTTTRFHDLAAIDTSREGGRPVLSLFRAQPRELPFTVTGDFSPHFQPRTNGWSSPRSSM